MTTDKNPPVREVAKRLQPWLDLANLVPASELELAPPEGALLEVMLMALERAEQKKLFFVVFAGPETLSREQRARKFYEMFYAVRFPLEQLWARSERPDMHGYRYLNTISG